MGLIPQIHNDPSSYPSPDNLQFYSAPTSPMARIGTHGFESSDDDDDDDDDDFEFETSHRFANGWNSESSPTFKWPHLDHDDDDQQQQQNLQRANSFSTMAFADELLVHGQVLPLKLPPRLQQATTDQSQGSFPTSPKSPSSVLRIPFGHRSTWNDNFDPFMVALEKVSDETIRGRKSIHRRARSHSPFRTTSTLLDYCADHGSAGCNQDQQRQLDPPGVAIKLNHEMVEAKGSAYARWVRSQTMEHKRSSSVIPTTSSQSLTRAKTSLFGGWPKGRHETIVKKTGENDGSIRFGTETKMQKVKSILLKYTSFGKEHNPASNYFKKLSFKFKGSDQKKKKKVCGESKIMALAKYNPKRPLCLGYVPASPTHI